MPPKPASPDAFKTITLKPLTSHFGKGYGDFTMKSSDNVLLSFPKVLLIHASPFFKDMFGIAGHAADSSPVDDTEPLVMEEDHATLEDLLLCIDPSKTMPPINPRTITKVLRAVHKYQIEKFIAYFAHVVGQQSTCACAVRTCGTFLSTKPMLVLSLAERYDLPGLARFALRQLVVQPMDKLLASNPAISPKTWFHLLHLRKQRTDWFLEYIDRIDRSRHRSGIRPSPQVCLACHSRLMTWTRKVHDTPSWCSIEKEIHTLPENCVSRLSRDDPPDLGYWEEEAKELEGQLPPLPRGVFGG